MKPSSFFPCATVSVYQTLRFPCKEERDERRGERILYLTSQQRCNLIYKNQRKADVERKNINFRPDWESLWHRSRPHKDCPKFVFVGGSRSYVDVRQHQVSLQLSFINVEKTRLTSTPLRTMQRINLRGDIVMWSIMKVGGNCIATDFFQFTDVPRIWNEWIFL